MSLSKSPSLNKISKGSSFTSDLKPTKRSQQRDLLKTRSSNKMPSINGPSDYYLPTDLSLTSNKPHKNNVRRIKTISTSHSRSTKNLSLSKQIEFEPRSFDNTSTKSSKAIKIKFPALLSDLGQSSVSKEETEDDDPHEKHSMSPVKKALQVITSSPTKVRQGEVHEGFSQAIVGGIDEKSLSNGLSIYKKSKSQPTYPVRNEKLKTQAPVIVKYTPSDNSRIQGINHTFTNAEDCMIPDLGTTKHSLKGNGSVKAYAANTNKGLVRNYNEDRVAIILNISKPADSTYQGVWPSCSYFAVYDGHGGEACADFLRDNLHQMVIRNSSFPSNPVAALRKGFAEAEAKFLEQAEISEDQVERSGSCALVLLIVDDMCYVANVGDSRAVLSCERGNKTVNLSRDHKPCDEEEKARILKNGGKVYQSQGHQQTKTGTGPFASAYNTVVMGPHRVFPGRLSVSRTFGDIEAKLPKYDGVPGVITAEPEIKTHKITNESDFIILGCDGIYDKLNSEEVVEGVWNSTYLNLPNVHQQSAAGVEYIMKQALLKKTTDNITALMISLAGFEQAVSREEPPIAKPAMNIGYGDRSESHYLRKLQNLKENGNDIRKKKKMGTLEKSGDSSYRRILRGTSETEKKKISISFSKRSDFQENSLQSPELIKLGKHIVLPKKKAFE